MTAKDYIDAIHGFKDLTSAHATNQYRITLQPRFSHEEAVWKSLAETARYDAYSLKPQFNQ